jgi:hypothetical protein
MSEEQKEQDIARFLDTLPEKRLEPKDCRHEQFTSFVAVHRLEDTGRFIAELRIWCVDCREAFRFQGLQPGVLHERPSCSMDALEARLPVEPEIEKQLFGGARFEMGPPPETRH